MAKLSPQQLAEKHNRRLKGSLQDMQAGINAVTEAPGAKAALKADKMLTNFTASVQSGQWGRRVAAVSLDEWKTAMLTKGVQRVSAGIDAAQGKVIDFFAELLPFQDNLKTQIDKMPDLTLEDGVNRAATWIRGMSNFKRGTRR